MFSIAPFCHEQYGSAKYTGTPKNLVMSLCAANSGPVVCCNGLQADYCPKRSAIKEHLSSRETLLLHFVLELAAPCSRLAARAVTAYLPWCSSDTDSFLRPFARRADSTRRPFFVAIRSRKPCLFALFLLWGWNVLFIFSYFYCYYSWGSTVRGCKITHFFLITKEIVEI